MVYDNEYLASLFDSFATLLELSGEDSFKIRAYTNAAFTLRSHQERLADVFRETGELPKLKGVGTALAEKLVEILKTGTFRKYDELKRETPEGVLKMLGIPGLGPKKVSMLYQKMGISDIRELEYACRENHLKNLKGFGERTQNKILQGISFLLQHEGRRLYSEAETVVQLLRKQLGEIHSIIRFEIAGSFRRMLETVKDIDVIIISDNPNVFNEIALLPVVEKVNEKGTKKMSVTAHGMQVDFRVFTEDLFPTAMHHFTGSKRHHEILRGIAKKQGYSLSEYGLFRGDEQVPVQQEQDIYRILGVPYCVPEMREGLFEFDRITDNDAIINPSDITGVFHVHTDFSDGANTVEEMVSAAAEAGFSYIGFADHSKSAFYASGLTEDDIKRQHEEIDRVQELYPHITIFKGIESDILVDGSLDYDDKTLARFDFVVASVHSRFQMTEEEMTERIVKAVQNPYTTILGHPTGRLLLSRQPYAVDMQRIIQECAATGTIIELNASPQRLDIDWRRIPSALDLGCMISINPDAHSEAGFAYIRNGVYAARKAGTPKTAVLNALTVDSVRSILRKKRG